MSGSILWEGYTSDTRKKKDKKKEKDKKNTNFKKLTDRFLEDNEVDAHEVKKKFLGKKAKIAMYDLYSDTKTKEILILLKGGKGDPIHTGRFLR